jgi:hypothetical protein
LIIPTEVEERAAEDARHRGHWQEDESRQCNCMHGAALDLDCSTVLLRH